MKNDYISDLIEGRIKVICLIIQKSEYCLVEEPMHAHFGNACSEKLVVHQWKFSDCQDRKILFGEWGGGMQISRNTCS